ncbi:MAG TPA: ATP synthase F1 subunit delta [Candidatus Limnocylindria bacterium]|nr:ATP synthase F1 subunit delta [Candidatus Limnocylindria bacterium]
MALSGSAARRYAEALLDLANAENAVAAFRASLDSLAAGISPQAIRALRDPSVPVKQRLAAIEAVTTGQPKAIRSLLLLLEQRDRIGLLPDIARAYADLVDLRAGIVKAKITTAVALDATQQRAFVERLEKSSGHKLKATFAVDQSLIGGAQIQLGDHLVDTSVRAQLNALRTQLAGN